MQLQSMRELQTQVEVIKPERCQTREKLNTMPMQLYIAVAEKQGLELSCRLERESNNRERQASVDVHKTDLQGFQSELSKAKYSLKRIV